MIQIRLLIHIVCGYKRCSTKTFNSSAAAAAAAVPVHLSVKFQIQIGQKVCQYVCKRKLNGSIK